MSSEIKGTSDRESPVIKVRKKTEYSPSEREFSSILQKQLMDLLEGKRSQLNLWRKYPSDPNRLGIYQLTPDMEKDGLRLGVVENMLKGVIDFVYLDETGGGPISQVKDHEGMTEKQVFSTKYPHIVIERTDFYEKEKDTPENITICLRRVQNQKAQTSVNRVFDVAALGIGLVRLLP